MWCPPARTKASLSYCMVADGADGTFSETVTASGQLARGDYAFGVTRARVAASPAKQDNQDCQGCYWGLNDRIARMTMMRCTGPSRRRTLR